MPVSGLVRPSGQEVYGWLFRTRNRQRALTRAQFVPSLAGRAFLEVGNRRLEAS